jgi:hypothetical protein
MPSLAAAAGMGYRPFALRALALRVPWLAFALGSGALAAHSITHIGHVAGIVGIIASGFAVVCLLIGRGT